MTKLLLGVGALLMASVAVPASAHDDNGYSSYGNGYGNNSGYGYDGGYGYNRGYGYDGGYANVVRQHVRECRQHARFHRRLAQEHDALHDQGFDNGLDHADAHDALDAAHDAYHDQHGDVQNCGYWNAQYYNLLQGSSYRGWNNRSNGWSLWFGR